MKKECSLQISRDHCEADVSMQSPLFVIKGVDIFHFMQAKLSSSLSVVCLGMCLPKNYHF